MSFQPAQLRVAIAALIGIVMVGAAFWFSHSRPQNTDGVTAAASEGSLITRQHIPVTDSDGNGVPDWQEKVLTTEPIYLDASTTLELPPPKNFTEQFADDYYHDMRAMQNLGIFEESRSQLTDAVIRDLAERLAIESPYTEADLNTVYVSDANGLRAYGNLVAKAILENDLNGEGGYTIFERLLRDNNPKHIEKLEAIPPAYEAIVTALLKVETPERYSFEHLTIVNHFYTLLKQSERRAQYFEDPLPALYSHKQSMLTILQLQESLFQLRDSLYLYDSVEYTENDDLSVLLASLQ